MKTQPRQPAPGQSTSDDAFSQLKQDIARQNDVAQKAARERRTIREDAARAQRRQWERESDAHLS